MRINANLGNLTKPVVVVTGRNEEGKIEYILGEEEGTTNLDLEVYLNKEKVTGDFLDKARNKESLATFRGGKATRLACDIISKIVQEQELQNFIPMDRGLLIYILKQVEFVCKENIEDVLGVRGMNDGLKDFKKKLAGNTKADTENDEWL